MTTKTQLSPAVRPALITIGVLLIPLFGDLYGGWAWRWPGFILFGAMLFGITLAFELAGHKLKGVAGGFVLGVAADVTLLAVLHYRHPQDDIAGFAMLSLFVSALVFSWAGWIVAGVRQRRRAE